MDKILLYKKNILAIISVSIIFFSMNMLVSGIASFDVMHPFVYSLLRNASTLPIILASIIVEALYKNIDEKHKMLKYIMVGIFVVFALFSEYINQSVLAFATL